MVPTLVLLFSLIDISFGSNLVPGITRVAQGYNIIIGNPLEQGLIDPGLLSPIFDTSHFSEGNSCSLNGATYSSPNGISCHSCVSCKTDWEFSEYHGIYSYSKKLSKSVSGSVGFGNFSFGASKSYQKVNEYTIEKKNIATTAEIQCAVICAALNYGDYPLFSTGFFNKVNQMPLVYNKTEKSNTKWFYDFITNGFGTHFIQSMQMGGRFGEYSQLTYYQYDTFYSSTYSVGTSASITAGVTGGLTTTNTKEINETKKWSQYSSDHSSYSYGAHIPSSPYPGDMAKWQEQLFKNNAPIYMSLLPLNELLKPEYWTRYHNISNHTLNKKQTALKAAIQDYCHQYVDRNPSIKSVYCNHIPPDNPVPVHSVFKGIYYAQTGYVNPYTLDLHCDSGYDPVNWLRWNQNYAYLCLYSSFKKNSLYYDPMGFFGGIYTMEYNGDTYVSCKLTSDSTTEDGVNKFTGKCSCPEGYSAYRFKQSRANKNEHYYPSYWCSKKNDGQQYGLIGGFYGTGRWPINNQFTKALSCPAGTLRYEVMNWKCDNVKDQKCTLYICLTNAWH